MVNLVVRKENTRLQKVKIHIFLNIRHLHSTWVAVATFRGDRVSNGPRLFVGVSFFSVGCSSPHIRSLLFSNVYFQNRARKHHVAHEVTANIRNLFPTDSVLGHDTLCSLRLCCFVHRLEST